MDARIKGAIDCISHDHKCPKGCHDILIAAAQKSDEMREELEAMDKIMGNVMKNCDAELASIRKKSERLVEALEQIIKCGIFGSTSYKIAKQALAVFGDKK